MASNKSCFLNMLTVIVIVIVNSSHTPHIIADSCLLAFFHSKGLQLPFYFRQLSLSVGDLSKVMQLVNFRVRLGFPPECTVLPCGAPLVELTGCALPWRVSLAGKLGELT